MFDKIKRYLKEKKIINQKNEIYNFEENKKLGKINFLDRIKFIRFKKKNENPDLNVRKIKEVRTFGYSCSFSRNWIYEFFYQ